MTNDHDQDPLDELARRAGAELRRSAPEGGIARLHRSRRRRRTASVAAGASAALCFVAGTAFLATRGGDGAAPTVETPTIVPVSSAPSEPPASSTSPPSITASPSTAPGSTGTPITQTTPAAAATSTSTAPEPTVPPTSVTAWPGQASSKVAVTYIGDASAAWAPLGWWDGSAWAEGMGAAAPPDSPIGTATAVGPDLFDGLITGIVLGEPVTYCAGPELGRTVDLGREVPPDVIHRGARALAVTADWPVQPRPVTRAGVDSPVYQQVGESLVADRPDVDPTLGDVTEVHRADLDGDGIEEVIFGFEHLTDTAGIGAAGDFSLVIARHANPDGTVQDQVLFEHYPEDPVDFPNPGRASVLAIADLNGDATMEVVVRSVFWEGSIAEAYELQSGRLVRVMVGGCGS